jgi:choline kinase
VRVVILAAGLGQRLMPLTRNTPKSLLDLGNGYTLLETQLEAIAACGISKVTLVTGYKSEQIEAKIVDYSGFDFTIRFNPFYRMANNAVSAWMGLGGITEPAVLVNGDDVFKASVLESLTAARDQIAMVVSRKGYYDSDDMKVTTIEERVVNVGKDLPDSESNGESIGMIAFRGPGLSLMQSELDSMMRNEPDLQLFYLEALRRLMVAGHHIGYVECDDDEWAEVDFHPDLDLMRNQVLGPLWE